MASLIPKTPFINARTNDIDLAWREFLDYLGRYFLAGQGSPEGMVPAAIGTHYHRLDGGAGTSFYVKESLDPLDPSTGWSAK